MTGVKRMAYLLAPFAFAICAYLLLYAGLHSLIDQVSDAWSMFALSETASADTPAESDSLYEGTVFHEGDVIASSTIRFPRSGTQYGRLFIEGTAVDAPLYFGDDATSLRRGVGQYLGSSFPGMGSTVLIGGHNNSYFRDLKNAAVGDTVTIETNYSTYVYEIERTEILRHDDASAYDLASDTENLVLYTCYPFNMLGLTPQRYFVYAKLVSGPTILLDR